MTDDSPPPPDPGLRPKAPPRVVAAMLGLMLVIAALSAMLFYFIAFGGLSARETRLAGLAYLLTAGPTLWLVYRITQPYR
jgi:hypothetical protein